MSLTEKEAEKKSCPFTFNVEKADIDFYRCMGSDCMAWEWDFRGGQQIPCDVVFLKEEPETRPESVPSGWKFFPYSSACHRYHACWEQPPEENRDNWTGHCHLIYRPCGGAE